MKKKKRRKPNFKCPTSKTWMEKADNANKALTHKKGSCEHCGSTKNLNAHHVRAKTEKKLRHDPRNMCLLCSNCHVFSSEFSAHLTPLAFSEWFKKSRPADYEYIMSCKWRNKKINYKKAYEELKELNNEQESGAKDD